MNEIELSWTSEARKSEPNDRNTQLIHIQIPSWPFSQKKYFEKLTSTDFDEHRDFLLRNK